MFDEIMAAMPKPPLVHNGRISHAQTNTEVFVLTGATYGIGTLRASVTQSVMTAANWVAARDSGKEVWLTEINWHGFDPTGWLTQTRRMTQLCATLPTLPINRYFWFYGNYPWDPVVRYASVLTDGSGALSPAGVQFALPLTYGGCPSRP